MNDALHWLLNTAVRAPSGDNTQPWRFEVDETAGRVVFLVDERRDPSPMNSGQRMARIAVGAALENLLRTAAHNGWATHLEEAAPPAVAAVRVDAIAGGSPGAEDVLRARVTNRRVYDGRPVLDDVLARVRSQTAPPEGTTTHWVLGPERLAPLADLIGRADATMFGEPSMRHAFLAKVRFDLPPATEAEEGLPLASLELSGGDLVGLKMMRWMPNWLLHLAGGMRTFAKATRRLVGSAAGLCMVSAPDRRPATDVTVGRAMQRAWLGLTAEGLAVQPMMSLPVLENALDQGTPELIASLGRDKVMGLLAELQKLAPELGGARLAYLLRFGYAPTVSGRTGRLPLAAVVNPSSVAVSSAEKV
jgi:hypothetical protein